MRCLFGRAAALAAAACVVLTATSAFAADKKQKEPRKPSVCVGLDTSACSAKNECTWRKETTTKTGKTRKAHCRKRSGQQLATTEAAR